MNDDFKNKLREYAEGKLSLQEKEKIEREIEKIEEYQAFIEEELGNHKPQNISEIYSENTGMSNDKKEARIIKLAKWKARIHNALTALVIILVGTFLCGLITSIYYSSGNPARLAVYRDVIESTIAITEPNLLFRGGGTGVNPYFSMGMRGDLRKEIGSEYVNAGEIQLSFLFNQVRFPERKLLIDKDDTWPFRYPTASASMNSDWKKLEKLPEGTVAEAYLSFDQFYTMDEVLQKFKAKDMAPVWFVVDTGFDDITANPRASFIGFPYHPIWHPDDMTVNSRLTEKKGLFTRVVSESASSPQVEEYGSGELRTKNFMKTLELLSNYEQIANRVALGGELRVPERINYLKKHGVKIYGIVVTGPSKEILKLKKEAWVAGIHLGEVRLWNWER